MPYTATDWTITSSDVKTFRNTPYKRMARMVLTSGANNYPSNGIPIPPAVRFGFRKLDYIVPVSPVVTPSGDDENIANYDHNFRSIRLFRLSTTSDAAQSWSELATTAAAGSISIYVEAHGR